MKSYYVTIMTNSKDNALRNWRTCVLVQFLQHKLQYMSAVAGLDRVRLFYVSNTKGGKTWFWDDIKKPFKDDALLNWMIGGSVRI